MKAILTECMEIVREDLADVSFGDATDTRGLVALIETQIDRLGVKDCVSAIFVIRPVPVSDVSRWSKAASRDEDRTPMPVCRVELFETVFESSARWLSLIRKWQKGEALV